MVTFIVSSILRPNLLQEGRCGATGGDRKRQQSRNLWKLRHGVGSDWTETLNRFARTLSEADLAFGELLPEKPGSIEQEEYEERTRVGFHLERLTRRAGERRVREVPSAAGCED